MDGWQTFVAGLECNNQYEMLFAERVTGPEAFITVDGNLAAVKKTAILFEETYATTRSVNSSGFGVPTIAAAFCCNSSMV